MAGKMISFYTLLRGKNRKECLNPTLVLKALWWRMEKQCCWDVDANTSRQTFGPKKRRFVILLSVTAIPQ